MALPKTPKPVRRDFPNSIIFYGKPKVGKTGICVELTLQHVDEQGNSRALHLDLEEGSHTRTIVSEDIKSIAGIESVIKEIDDEGVRRSKDPKYAGDVRMMYPYDFLIVDTLDRLEEMCAVNSLIKYKKSVQGAQFKGDSVYELAHGLGYGLVREEMKRVINELRKRCLSLILISHTDDKNLTVNNVMVTTTDISLAGKLKTIVPAMVDCVGQVYRHPSKKLYVSFIHTGDQTMSARLKYLTGKNEEFDWQKVYPSLISKSITEPAI